MKQSVKYIHSINKSPFEIKISERHLHAFKPHVHDEYSIGLIHKGRATIPYNEKEITAEEKQIMAINSNVVHYCNPDEFSGCSYSMLYIDKNWLEDTISADDLKKSVIVKTLSDKDYHFINTQFNYMANIDFEISHEEICIGILDLLFSLKNESEYTVNRTTTNAKIIKIKEYIDLHFMDDINLKTLQMISDLSKYYLVKSFKKCYDVTPYAYQISLKLNYSKKRLLETKDIAFVALELNYFDQSHFTKAFKEYVGVTPKEYIL